MYVPWRRVASWHCTACGECCRKFKPKLTFYEYLKLRGTGFVEERVGRYYLKKVNGSCPFQRGNLCTLQGEMKPLSCKVFPFLVRKRPAKDAGLALYELDDVYYVYVSTDCPNVVLSGEPVESPDIAMKVREAVELVTGVRRNVERITCREINPCYNPVL